MLRIAILLVLVAVSYALDLAPEPKPKARYPAKKITKVIVKEEKPRMMLGERELRRLEPYFVKQAWNWQQLYDKQCTSNPHPGGCAKTLTRWFFYPTFGKCYAFMYGGCGGTTNRFLTEKECMKTCIPKQLPLRPPPILREVTLAPPPDSAELSLLLEKHDNLSVAALQKLAEPPTKPTTTTTTTPKPITQPPTPSTPEATPATEPATEATSGAGGGAENSPTTPLYTVKIKRGASHRNKLNEQLESLELDAFDLPEFAHVDRIVL